MFCFAISSWYLLFPSIFVLWHFQFSVLRETWQEKRWKDHENLTQIRTDVCTGHYGNFFCAESNGNPRSKSYIGPSCGRKIKIMSRFVKLNLTENMYGFPETCDLADNDEADGGLPSATSQQNNLYKHRFCSIVANNTNKIRHFVARCNVAT